MILSTLMIPIHVTFIPLYIIIREMGLLDTLWALILPGTASAFGIFLMRQYIQTLPSELEDAARIDGCSEFGVFWNVILPLCQPGIAARLSSPLCELERFSVPRHRPQQSAELHAHRWRRQFAK